MRIAATALLAILYFPATIALAEDYMGMEPLIFHDDDVPWTESNSLAGEQLKVLFGTEDTAGQFTLITANFSTRDTVVTPHKHNWHDETFYVLRGSFLITNGDLEEQTIVREGAAVFAPRGTWHAWEALEPDSQILMFYTPSGFEKVYSITQEFTPEQRMDSEFMEEFGLRYDSISYQEP